MENKHVRIAMKRGIWKRGWDSMEKKKNLSLPVTQTYSNFMVNGTIASHQQTDY